MAYDNNNKSFDDKRNAESIFSKRIKAGKRRTYFFDVRETRGSDYFVTITESKKRFNDDGYDRHKMFIYKEDFHKFLSALTETIDYVKTELMPDFDFDSFNHDEYEEGREYNGTESNSVVGVESLSASSSIENGVPVVNNNNDDDDSGVDAWKI